MALSPEYNFLSLLDTADDGYPAIELDYRDDDGRTPLHIAAKVANLPGIILLLRKGVQVNRQDEKGKTALSLAGKYGPDTMAAVLVENGARLELSDNRGRTPLSYAAEGNDPAMIGMLIRVGALIDSRDQDGWAPLHWAVKRGDSAIVQALIRWGAELNIQNRENMSPLTLAASVYQQQVRDIPRVGSPKLLESLAIIIVLLSEGAQIDEKDIPGLQEACVVDHVQSEFKTRSHIVSYTKEQEFLEQLQSRSEIITSFLDEETRNSAIAPRGEYLHR